MMTMVMRTMTTIHHRGSKWMVRLDCCDSNVARIYGPSSVYYVLILAFQRTVWISWYEDLCLPDKRNIDDLFVRVYDILAKCCSINLAMHRPYNLHSCPCQ